MLERVLLRLDVVALVVVVLARVLVRVRHAALGRVRRYGLVVVVAIAVAEVAKLERTLAARLPIAARLLRLGGLFRRRWRGDRRCGRFRSRRWFRLCCAGGARRCILTLHVPMEDHQGGDRLQDREGKW